MRATKIKKKRAVNLKESKARYLRGRKGGNNVITFVSNNLKVFQGGGIAVMM